MVARFNPAQQIGIFRHQAPAILNARWRQHDAVAIVFPLHAAFGLAPIQFDHALIGLQPGEGLIERCIRDPGAARIGAHPFQEAFKALTGNRHIGRRHLGCRGLVGGISLRAAGRDQGRDSAEQEPSFDHGDIWCHGLRSMANAFAPRIGRGGTGARLDA